MLVAVQDGDFPVGVKALGGSQELDGVQVDDSGSGWGEDDTERVDVRTVLVLRKGQVLEKTRAQSEAGRSEAPLDPFEAFSEQLQMNHLGKRPQVWRPLRW